MHKFIAEDGTVIEMEQPGKGAKEFNISDQVSAFGWADGVYTHLSARIIIVIHKGVFIGTFAKGSVFVYDSQEGVKILL